MTSKIVAECDICGCYDQDVLVGLMFVNERHFQESAIEDAHKHICFRCISKIKKISLRDKRLQLEGKISELHNQMLKLEDERKELMGER